MLLKNIVRIETNIIQRQSDQLVPPNILNTVNISADLKFSSNISLFSSVVV